MIMASRVLQLADQLRRDITLGRLRPGARLNIEALKREHCLSHPSVREALAILAGEGYVSLEGNKGYHVLEVSIAALRDTARLRAELECIGLKWSSENGGTDWRAGIVAAHHALHEIEQAMEANTQPALVDWDERNKRFHLALIQFCGSPQLLETVNRYYDLTRRYRLMAYEKRPAEQLDWLHRSSREHEIIKDAVLAGEIDSAIVALRGHITKPSF